MALPAQKRYLRMAPIDQYIQQNGSSEPIHDFVGRDLVNCSSLNLNKTDQRVISLSD